MTKPNPKDWRNRPIADWTLTSFRQYLADEHERRYCIAYVTNNYGMEGRNMKAMIAEHGPEIVRVFIDGCFDDYRPTAQWPGLSFNFMFSYQRGRVLPRVLAAIAERSRRKEASAKAVKNSDNQSWEELSDWL